MLVMMSAVDDHDSCCGDSYNNYCENSHDCDDGLSDNKFKIFKNMEMQGLIVGAGVVSIIVITHTSQ